MHTHQAIFPLLYLGSVDYFKELVQQGDSILLERQENYPKQTYRNRTSIYSPNGKLDLIIPVKKGSGEHTPYKDVRISYDNNWQRIHWLSLQTAYRRSAYFEFYEDEFIPFYHHKTDFLFDYNEQLFSKILQLLKIKKNIVYTESYEKTHDGLIDWRENINPHMIDNQNTIKEYYQVFSAKHGYIPHLSMLDMLFNLGPNTLNYLKI